MTDAETTRQRLLDELRREPGTASDLSTRLGAPRSAVYDHVRHVARSLEGGDERLLVAPPECRECGFSAFDDPVNEPSRCPECKNEGISEPVFTVEPA